MLVRRLPILIATLSLVSVPLGAGTVSADDRPEASIVYMGTSTAVHSDVSPPLRDIPPAPRRGKKADQDDPFPPTPCGPPEGKDPVVQVGHGSSDGMTLSAMPAPNVSFDGFVNDCGGCAPPDPVGDVGPNHYVAMANSTIAVYSKTGTTLLTPRDINTIWTGFGGACEAENAGDPVVLYDQFADRWLVSQFTANGPTYYNCVALSITGDPTGSWQRYAFSNGTSFPDYPKYGVWRDGYYFSTRNTSGSTGQGAYALNRDQMLAGSLTPQVVSFLLTPGTTPYYGGDGLLPVDIDGSTLPPVGAPMVYLGTMDNSGPYGAPQDAINLFQFKVNWASPASSTFTRYATVPVAAFDSTFTPCGGGRACIGQLGTANKIDILSYRQRATFRAAYRNFGTHESIVTNQSVSGANSGSAAAIAGVRWYELRDPNGTPTIFQQGTYAPGATDGIHRWMGSAAMDRTGNLAIGYSASSGSINPGIRYAGRLVTDPLNQLPQTEGTLVNGSGSQTGGGSRWGDYTSLNVDSTDDCTFWYVNEYYTASSSANWRLRIGSFTFPNCLCAVIPPAPTASATAPADNRIDVSWNDSSNGSITRYFVQRATVSGGPHATVATVTDTSPGVGGGAPYTWQDLTVSGGTTYYYVVRSDDGATCTSPPSAQVNATATGACTLSPSFAGLVSVTNGAVATCTLNLSWSAGSSLCGGGVTYKVYRSTTDGFLPSPANLIASGVAATSYVDSVDLISGTRYYYVVRAVDAGSGSEDPNSVQASGVPTGVVTGPTTVASTDVPKSILDNTTITSTLSVANTSAISDINVTISNITHTWDADLNIFLVAPNATRVELSTGNGGSSDNYLNTVFDDAAATSITAAAAPFSGTFRPETPLSVLNGMPANGTWTLEIRDTASGDTGTLNSWSITLMTGTTCTTASGCLPPGAPTLVSANASCGGVALAWSAGSGTTLSYNVYRGPSSGGPWTKIAGPLGATSYADTSAVAGTTYHYMVRGACDAGGVSESVNGNSLSATMPGCPNLVYKSGSFLVAQQQGDADATAMAPGEKWRLSWVMTNIGTGAATNAFVTVSAANGLSSSDFCANPVSVGSVAPGADSGLLSADFVVPAGWSGACPSDVPFGFVGKTHSGGAPAGADELPGSASVSAVKKAMGKAGGVVSDSATLTAVADAYGARANQTTNYGSSAFVRVGGKETSGLSQVRGLYRFDLSTLPAGATVTSATLELTAVGTASSNRTINVFGVTSAWAEGSVTYATLPSNDATTRGSFTTGTTLGLKSTAITTALVQGWVDTPATNFGLWLQDANDSNNTFWDFGSREHGTAGSRPRLVVAYTVAEAPTCAAWGGSASCSNAKPVPDGLFVTGTPLLATETAGGQVAVTWDVSGCTSSDYNLYAAPIGQYTTYTIGACNVGTTGSWTGTLAGSDLWWGVAGTDAGSTLSSIVRQSDGTENPTTGWAGVCAVATSMSVGSSCP